MRHSLVEEVVVEVVVWSSVELQSECSVNSGFSRSEAVVNKVIFDLFESVICQLNSVQFFVVQFLTLN